MNNPYEVLLTNKTYAVIGLSDDTSKFAYRIYTLLKNKGKRAYGLHPKNETVDGEPVYKSFDEIPHDIDVAVFVVNPTIGITYLEAIKDKGIETIWLQPGTVSDELVHKAEEMGLTVIEDCVLATYARNESH